MHLPQALAWLPTKKYGPQIKVYININRHEDAINFSHNNENKLKDMGKQLLAEAMSQAHYGSRMNTLSDKLPEKLFIVTLGETVPILDNFLTHAADLFENGKNFCGSIVVVLLENLACTYTGGRKNPLIEERAKNFYCWLDTISPVACDAVGANIGGVPYKRWMQVLNAKERSGNSHI